MCVWAYWFCFCFHLYYLTLYNTLINYRKNVCEEDAKQLERLYNMFSSCLELLEVELFQTLRLQKMFPLQSGNVFEHPQRFTVIKKITEIILINS